MTKKLHAKTLVRAEISVLDRIMHLLEEQSVDNLVSHDQAFGDFISNLYADVDNKVLHLEQAGIS